MKARRATAPTAGGSRSPSSASQRFYADRARLMIFDRAAGTTVGVTENWDRSRRRPRLGTRFAQLVRRHRRRRHAARVSLPARWRRARGASPKASSFGALALSRNGKGLVAIRQSFTEPPTLVSIAPRSGAATKLSTFNDAALAGFDQGKVESVTYKGAKDADIQMWVVYPPGFDATQEVPGDDAAARRPAQRHHRRGAVALERGGVRELGLRGDLAQLPRLERLRQ